MHAKSEDLLCLKPTRRRFIEAIFVCEPRQTEGTGRNKKGDAFKAGGSGNRVIENL